MARHQWGPDDKTKALAVLKSVGGNYSAAERACGVPKGTIREWALGRGPMVAPAEVEAAVDDLKDLIRGKLGQVLAALTPEKLAAANAQTLSLTFGILFDKHRLLDDKPTSITEERSGTDEEAIAAINAAVFGSELHPAGLGEADGGAAGGGAAPGSAD